jgi:hypothetical protein
LETVKERDRVEDIGIGEYNIKIGLWKAPLAEPKKTILDLWVTKDTDNFLTSWETINLPRMTRMHEVSQFR